MGIGHSLSFAEIFFGECLRGLEGVAQYIETFTTFQSSHTHLWIAYLYEGVSLGRLLYSSSSVAGTGDFVVLKATTYAHSLHANGKLRLLLHNIANAVKNIHLMNVTHRDIKPENILIRNVTKVTLCDFGSSVNPDMDMGIFYPDGIDTGEEETVDYKPPELRLLKRSLQSKEVMILNDYSVNSQYHKETEGLHLSQSYDMWSLGTLFLEILLGTPKVFDVNDRIQAIISAHFHGSSREDAELRDRAVFLAALIDFGIVTASPSIILSLSPDLHSILPTLFHLFDVPFVSLSSTMKTMEQSSTMSTNLMSPADFTKPSSALTFPHVHLPDTSQSDNSKDFTRHLSLSYRSVHKSSIYSFNSHIIASSDSHLQTSSHLRFIQAYTKRIAVLKEKAIPLSPLLVDLLLNLLTFSPKERITSVDLCSHQYFLNL